MKPKNIAAVFITILLVSCLSGPSPVPTQTAASTVSLLPTSTALTSTSQPTQFFTPTQTFSSEDCGSHNNLPQTNTIGQIVFYKPDKGLYFYDPLKGKDSPAFAATEMALYIESSPDQKKIALFNQPGASGEVITSDGNNLVVNTEKINGIFYGWLDNQKIIFVGHAHSDGSVIILDTETRKTEEKITNLTDVNFDPIHWYAGGSQPSVVFNHGLSRLVYTSMEVPPTDQVRLGFILRDYDTRNILWSKQSSDIAVKPKWSPDGKYLAVVVSNENNDQIYILDRDGKETQMIDTNIFGVDQIEWSPNSEQIGFDKEETLIVYNLAVKQKREFTLPQNIYKIIWSPNSNQLAVKGALIDLSTNCVFNLKSENKNGPLAWLVE